MPTSLDPSKLDDYFGPQPDPPAPLPPRRSPDEVLAGALVGGTRWNCEDRIKATLDAFVDTMGEAWMPRSAMLRQGLYASARPIVDEIGEDQAPDFVRWACQQSADRRLDTKNLRSLAYLIPEWRSREASPAWMRTPCPSCCCIHGPGACSEDDPPEDRMQEKTTARRLRWPDSDQADPPDADR